MTSLVVNAVTLTTFMSQESLYEGSEGHKFFLKKKQFTEKRGYIVEIYIFPFAANYILESLIPFKKQEFLLLQKIRCHCQELLF